MKDRVQLAVNTFKEGFNCSQSVFSAFSELFGIEMETAYRVSSGFGAGMGRQQEVCGAISGAIMLIGMKYGKIKADDKPAQEKTYETVRKLCGEFIERNGSISCKEILGCIISTPEGMQYAIEHNLFRTTCVKCVEDAAQIVNRIIHDESK